MSTKIKHEPLEGLLLFHIGKVCELLQEELTKKITASVISALDEKIKNRERANSSDKLLNVSEVAALLGVSKSTINKLRSDNLPTIKIGDAVRFEKQQVLLFLQKYKQEGGK